MYSPRGIFVDGRWTDSSGTEVLPLVDPATEERVADVTVGTADDVHRAVGSAQTALNAEWRSLSLEDRSRLVKALGRALAGKLDAIAEVQTIEMGAPISVSRFGVRAGIDMLDLAVEDAKRIAFQFTRRDAVGQALVRREPVGVVGAIIPWNGPLPLVLSKVVPALLAGCTVVVKPAPEAPFDAGFVVDAATEVGLPPGVINLVPGGRETGELLVRHPGVQKITFTGSTTAGRTIGAICGETFKRMSLELGGKSAAIVLDDCDVADAAKWIAMGCFGNSGQNCSALSRVLAPKAIYTEVVDALSSLRDSHTVGDPLDEATTMGPLVAARQRDRVEALVASAIDEGALIASGGRRPPQLERGWYFEPTVIVRATNSMRVAREEIFGPVITVIEYADEREAIALANDSEYGLHGAVFTSDPSRGLDVAKQVVTGTIAVNSYRTNPTAPFGGVKSSGIGRERGPEGIEAFLEYKSYMLPSELLDEFEANTRAGVSA
jgi:acyl-CoA reductase-like NAD-dependent aldehyde dehydrogenase